MRHVKSHVARLLFPSLLFMFGNYVLAQSGAPLTLQQCIEYGLTHNASVMRSDLEIENANYQILEGRSGYLPQINGSLQLIDNLKLQTVLLPGEFVGAPGTKVPVQFGTKYNLTGAIDASQKIYDQTSIVAIKAAGVSETIARLNSEKTRQQLTYDIANAYYSAQITFTQRGLIESNLARIDTLLRVTTVQFNNGFARKIDVDRLQVNLTNLQTDLANTNANYEQQLMVLKYLMGMPLDQPLSIPALGANEKVNATLVNTANVSSIDLQLLQTQNELNSLSLKQIKAGYLPSLSFIFHAGAQFQQNQFRVFEKENWYPNAYVGLNLSVPVFDGFTKYARASQTRIRIKQNEYDQQYLSESIKMQVANGQNKLSVNLASLETQQRNIALAQEVYEVTRVQYTNGMISLTDLVNSENELRTAQTNYLTSLVQVRLAELDLIKATGNYNAIK